MDIHQYFRDYQRSTARAHELLEQIPATYVPDRVVLAWEQGKLFSPAWQKGGRLERAWINVIVHNAAVGLLTFRLGSHLWHQLLIEGTPLGSLVEAALVHDSYKRQAEEFKYKAVTDGKDVVLATIEAEAMSCRFLTDLGFPKQVITLTAATGINALDFIRSGQPVLLAQKLILYADACVSGGQIVGYLKRFKHLKPHFESGGRYAGVNESFLKIYGKSHQEVWDSVILPIQDELARLIKFSGVPEDLYTIL